MRTWLLALAVAALPTAAALAADAEPRTWALGWADGLTLRHQLTHAWDLNLAAGPNDSWEERTRIARDDDDPQEAWIGSTPTDDKREQGWVRLTAGRRLSGDGPVLLSGILGLRYLWSREQDYHETVYDPGVDQNLTLIKTNRDDWNLDLGLRLGAALNERFWLETRFGLVYAWRSTDERETRRRLQDGDYSEDIEETHTDLKTFRDYGWYGLGSLDLVFWF